MDGTGNGEARVHHLIQSDLTGVTLGNGIRGDEPQRATFIEQRGSAEKEIGNQVHIICWPSRKYIEGYSGVGVGVEG